MESTNSLNKKVVVITGASAGLGRATVREFAQHGAHIGLLARGEDGLKAAKQEVEDAGGKAVVAQTDVSDPEQIEAAADKVEEEFGPIDIWINIAMVSVFAPLKNIEPEEFKRVTDVTYHGQVYGVMAALKRMLPRDNGTIILGGSALAYRGIPLQSAYCGSKHAIHGFFESLRAELIHDGSNVNLSMVQLPAMNTTQFGWVLNKLPRKPKPMGQIFEPEVAARVIFDTALNPEREVFVGYPTAQTILGNKVLPGWLDHYLAKTGYSGQQTDEPKDLDTKNNLWEPVEGDHGARGPFDAQAWDFSPKFWAATHKWADTAIAVTVSLGAGVLLHKLFSGD
jgi:NAD(P)-dependent dehydrogenase (short-subunit alcohol dehydrogenase family)